MEGPVAPTPPQAPPVTDETRAIMAPLAAASGWLKFLGILGIVTGCFTALTCYGLVIAWLPIWIGVLQLQAASGLRNGFDMADGSSLYHGADKLRLSLKIQGILMICIIAFYIIFFALFIVMAILGNF